jgi:hypothetical protein
MNSDLQCPIDGVAINENKARIVALLVLLVDAGYLSAGSFYLIIFLMADFLLRALKLGKYSLLSLIADFIVSTFKIKYKRTDSGPKRFAAGTGFVFTVLILIATAFQWFTAAFILGVVLVIFAFLESAIGFCAGCYVYTLLHKMPSVFKN